MKIIKFPEVRSFITPDDTLCIQIDEDTVLQIPPVSIIGVFSKMIERIIDKGKVSQEVFDRIKRDIGEGNDPEEKMPRKSLTEPLPIGRLASEMDYIWQANALY